MALSWRLWLGLGVLGGSTAAVLWLLSDSHEGAQGALLQTFADQQRDQAELAALQLNDLQDSVLAAISDVLWKQTDSLQMLREHLSLASRPNLTLRLVEAPPGLPPGVVTAPLDPAALRAAPTLPVYLPISSEWAVKTSIPLGPLGERLGTTRQGSVVWLVDRQQGTLLASATPDSIGVDMRAAAGPCVREFQAVLVQEHGTAAYCWPDGDASQQWLASFVSVDFFGLPSVVGVSADSTQILAPLAQTRATTREIAVITSLSAFLMLMLGWLELRAQTLRERADALSTLGALTTALEARDPYTRFHSENVSVYASELARRMGMSAAAQEQVRLAGLMHDIGKIGICDAVLNKPGRLTPDERKEIETHAALGEHILCHMSWASDLAAAVGAHHERMDGKGYPRGLTGDGIPRDARIVAVADVFDALITDRPYRDGMPLPKVIAIITDMAGSHLDTDVVDALLLDPASLLSMGRGVRMAPREEALLEAPALKAARRA